MGHRVNRFFRTSDHSLYEQVRLVLDAAWGHSTPTTCISPADVAPRDSNGRILLAVRQEFLDFAAVADMLPGLLASGVVEEITEAEYWATMTQPDPVDT
jgi:hypothetical protein